MKKNKYIYILFTILILFSFSSNANAAIEGYCLYSRSEKESFMIKQDSKGNITYYYAESKPTDDTSNDWKKDSNNKYKYEIKDEVSTPLEKCPTYMQYNYITGITFYNSANGMTSPNQYINITFYKSTIGSTTLGGTTSTAEDAGKIISSSTVSMETCEDILGEDLISVIQDLVNIVKIGVPIILIVLGTLDFGKAILSSDENEMKKAQGAFIKRLIIAVAIFLIPTILGVVLDIANKVWGNIDTTLCGIEF